ncbi:MAG: restriction endonuclease subunit S [Bacteroidales bacterium]|jgi:type I restriction enzyme S subunit|nr:restriction endonuclease subunit S [Bacteroidales bacterium]
MKKYEKYKDSGIEWLGIIPEHWKIRRIKDLGEYKSGTFIDAIDIDIDSEYPVMGGNGLRGYTNKYNRNGSYVLIGRQGALCGNINYANGKFWATEHAVVVHSKKNIDIKWLGELLNIMNLNQYSFTTAQPGLSVEKIKALELPLISHKEQKAIADYLDTKTQLIDKQIELLNQKVDTYKELRKTIINKVVCRGLNENVKFKDSGIDWIGKIPEHWKIERFKNFANTLKGKNLEYHNSFFENSLPNLSLDYLRSNSSCMIYYCYSPDKSLIAKENDLIIIWDGAGVGEILKAKKGYISSTIAKLVFTKKCDPGYFYYFRYILEYTLKRIPTGMGIPHLNPTVLNNFRFPFPPIEEQKEIKIYLDEKTQKIDSILKNIYLQIVKLQELRKTLINDVVTGKIKVTE